MAETSSNTTLYVLGGGALLLALAAGGAHAYQKRKRKPAAAPSRPAPTVQNRSAGILERFKRGEKMYEDDLLVVANHGVRTGDCASARKAVTQLARAEGSFKKVYVNEIEAARDDVKAACGRAAPQRKRKKARLKRRRRRS